MAMTAPTPCDWPIDDSCLPEDADPAMRDTAVALATDVLWALSGRQYGACPVTVRPCPTGRYEACWCSSSCEATGPRVVHLYGPVDSVIAIQVDGVLLDDSEWVVEGNLLYRVGGVWPVQDRGRPLGESGTWSVEYRRGVRPPEQVGRLVGLLAAEFYAACTGGKCRLPRRVQTVSRQGVTMQLADPTDIYESGKTGIPEVDMWLAAVNPNHIPSGPVVR